MKKQKIQFLSLLAAAVLLCAAYAGIRLYNENSEKKEAESKEAQTITVTDMEVSDISGFSYIADGKTLSFTKKEDGWQYDGDLALEIDSDAVETMLSKAVNVTAEESVEEYDNLSDFGLENPVNTITLKTADGETVLYVGNQNAITNQHYLKQEGDNRIYLVGSAVATGFNSTVEDLIKVEEETETENVTEISTEEM